MAVTLALLSAFLGDGGAQTLPTPGTVRGCVERAGDPVYRGVASLWPAGQGKAPDPRLAIRPPLVSGPLDANGCFTLLAAPGDYFVGAVVRLTDGGWQGPPRPGDMVFLSPDAAGGNVIIAIRPGETVDLGRHTSGWVYAGFTATTLTTTITGTLTDSDGEPLAGLLVFAFTDSTMSKDPLAVSEPSDKNGRYQLRLPEPATVFLRARQNYGSRSPTEGGYMGVYGGDVALPVTVNSQGDKEPRNLTVYLIPPLAVRQKGEKERPPGGKED